MDPGRRKVLVTGARGFIGRHLVEALGDDFDVFAPVRPELDLTDERSVAAFFAATPVDAVIHSATTPAHRNAPPSPVTFRNLRMFELLSRYAGPKTRIIVLGSGSEYDASRPLVRVAEEDFGRHLPSDENGFSKYLISRCASGDPRVYVLRLFGVFGPWEDWEIRFVSNAICKAQHGRPITLRQNRRFDYLWIEDLAPIVKHFLHHSPPERQVNVTPDESVELLAVASHVRDLAGARPEVRVGSPGMGLEYSGDNRRLHALLPGVRFTPIAEAVGKLWQFYDRHRDIVRPEALDVDK